MHFSHPLAWTIIINLKIVKSKDFSASLPVSSALSLWSVAKVERTTENETGCAVNDPGVSETEIDELCYTI